MGGLGQTCHSGSIHLTDPEVIRNTQMNVVRNVFWGGSEVRGDATKFFSDSSSPFSHSGEEEAGTAHQKRKVMKPHSRTVSTR